MGTQPNSRGQLWASIAGALILGAAGLFPLWTSDLFGHLAAGRQIAELGRVPDFDTFSFYFDTPRPWRNHNWGAGLVLWWLYGLGGAPLLVLTKVVVLALLAVILVRSCERGTLAPWVCVLIFLWVVPAVRIRFSMRPHLFGLLACAVLLDRLRYLALWRGTGLPWRTLAGLAVLQVVWVNTHGSGPMAFLLAGSYLLGHATDRERRRVYLAALGTLALASCVSPWGPSILLETFMHIGSEGTRHFIGEWNPIDFDSEPWDLWPCLVMLAVLAWGAGPLWRSGPVGRSGVLVALGMFVMAFRSMRFIDHALLLAVPVIASGVVLRLAAFGARPVRAVLAALAALGLVCVPVVAAERPPYQGIGWGVSTRNLPAAPGRWLAAHRPTARIAALMEDGWYLSFAVPHSKVLIDGRQAVYPLDVLQRVSGDLTVPDRLLALVEEKGADVIVLRHNRPEHAASIARLSADPRFGVASVGDRHVLFVRGLPGDQAIRTLQPNLGLRAFAPEQRDAARAELARIGAQPGAAAYAGFQRALLRLSPDLRGGGRDGLSPAADAEAGARYQQALAELAPALPRNENLPTAQLLAAMIEIRLCHLSEAERALDLARAEGENRHTVALAIELAAQRGEREAARQMLASIAVDRGSDPWLSALEAEVRAPPRCP